MTTIQKISTEKAPKALGPYSQGIIAGNFIFVSGQGGIDPKSGVLADGIEAQSHQIFQNIQSILEEAGSGLDNVVKTTCFLKNLDDFQAFNKIYENYLTKKPARSCIEASDLPGGFLVEVEVIACL